MTTLLIPTEAPKVRGPRQGKWTYRHWEALPDDGNRFEAPQMIETAGTLVLDCLPTLSIPVAELFAGAPDTTL